MKYSQNIKFLLYFRKVIQKAKAAHDDEYMNFDFDGLMDKFVRLRETPYLSSVASQEKEREFQLRFKDINSRFYNLIYANTPYLPAQNDLGLRMDYYLRRRTQSLCRGEYERPPAIEIHLNWSV